MITNARHPVLRHVGHFLALTATLLGSAGLVYTVAARGYGEQWGTSESEAAAVLPGDELIADSTTPMTRAVTIDAPPAVVWPWLVQFGQGRGGLYSYDWLENLFGCDITTLDHIDPALQSLAVGDRVWVTPDGYPADLGMVVDQIQPERALVLRYSTVKQPLTRAEAPWTWSFVLEPTADGRTRLIARERYRRANAIGDGISRQVVGPLDFVMSRRMLTGIAERAEQAAGHRSGPSQSETIWFAGAAIAAGGLLVALASRMPLRSRLALAAIGGASLVLITFRFQTPWLSWPLAILSVAVAVNAWRPSPHGGNPRSADGDLPSKEPEPVRV